MSTQESTSVSKAEPAKGEGPTLPSVTRETLHELPPSAKLVLKVLEFEGTLTKKELTEQTRLPDRTVREAACRLMDEGIVEERPYFRDARQSTYSIIVELP